MICLQLATANVGPQESRAFQEYLVSPDNVDHLDIMERLDNQVRYRLSAVIFLVVKITESFVYLYVIGYVTSLL